MMLVKVVCLLHLLNPALISNLGFDVVAADCNIRKDAYWFGEAQSRVVVSVNPQKWSISKKLLGNHPYEELGFVTDGADRSRWHGLG